MNEHNQYQRQRICHKGEWMMVDVPKCNKGTFQNKYPYIDYAGEEDKETFPILQDWYWICKSTRCTRCVRLDKQLDVMKKQYETFNMYQELIKLSKDNLIQPFENAMTCSFLRAQGQWQRTENFNDNLVKSIKDATMNVAIIDTYETCTDTSRENRSHYKYAPPPDEFMKVYRSAYNDRRTAVKMGDVMRENQRLRTAMEEQQAKGKGKGDFVDVPQSKGKGKGKGKPGKQ